MRGGVASNMSGIRSPKQIRMFSYILFTICLPSCRAKLGFSQPSLTFGIHQQYERTFSFSPFVSILFTLFRSHSVSLYNFRVIQDCPIFFLQLPLLHAYGWSLFSMPWHLPKLLSLYSILIYKIHTKLARYVLNNNNWAIKESVLGRN